MALSTLDASATDVSGRTTEPKANGETDPHSAKKCVCTCCVNDSTNLEDHCGKHHNHCHIYC